MRSAIAPQARALLMLLLAAWLGPTPTLAAELHALVVGINEYDHHPRLAGAVADADDIAGALRRIGARSLTVLRDREATRASIVRGWTETVRRARAGDTIVLTYAGHGSFEPWTRPGGKTERAETFILSAFSPRGPGSAERILDKEINAWFKAAAEGKVRILFVADSCHSGGMVRALDDSRVEVTYRSIPPYGMPEVLVTSSSLGAGAGADMSDLPHVTFLAATQADRRIPEVLIGGRKRGALSYAFARALEGDADRRGRGTLSQFDLASFVTVAVRQLSEAQQTPEITYRSSGGAEHEPILTGIPRRKDADLQLAPWRLRLANTDDQTRQGLERSLVGVEVVAAGEAEMVWDAKDRTVLSGLAEPVAYGIAPTGLQGVIDKWRVLPLIKEMVSARPLSISLHPGDGRHIVGSEVRFKTPARQFEHLTVFNLAADGSVQFLHPQPGRSWRDDEPLKVVPPFGADHLVVIASAIPLRGLHSRLRGDLRTIDLPIVLKEAFSSVDYVIGMQGVYTHGGKQVP